MSNIRDFIPLSKLGEGTYSTVYKVQRRSDGKVYALKKVKMNQLTKKEQENALNEIRILASIESPAIISYKQAFFDENINVLCIVMEYADGGDLHHLITQTKKYRTCFPEQEIWAAVKSMLLGLENLHSRGIMHRDLKSANVFKTSQGYKLGDLNVSKVTSGSLAYTQTGTPYYASPQVWRDQPYDFKSDIWSLGVIIYEMAALKPPYEGRDLQELFKNVQNRPIPSLPERYSQDLKDLINYCLNKKALRRPTAAQLLKHPPFQKYFQSGDPRVEAPELSNQFKPNKQQLLQTIKLPSDLTKLKEKLPESKYEGEKLQNKSDLIEKYNSRGSSSQRTPVNGQNINKSQLFKSPSSRLKEESTKITRAPVSEVKLNPKLSEVVAKYSDRIYHSDKKSNKVERSGSRNQQQAYFNLEQYIRNDITKRPVSQNSMPRTEKQQQKEILPTQIRSQNQIPNDIEEMRKRLVKKCRVLSNNPKPFWWG